LQRCVSDVSHIVTSVSATNAQWPNMIEVVLSNTINMLAIYKLVRNSKANNESGLVALRLKPIHSDIGVLLSSKSTKAIDSRRSSRWHDNVHEFSSYLLFLLSTRNIHHLLVIIFPLELYMHVVDDLIVLNHLRY